MPRKKKTTFDGLTSKLKSQIETRPEFILDLRNKLKKKETEEDKPSQKGKKLISWTASEFTKYEKGPLWFVVGALLTVVLLIVAILNRSPIMAITFVLMAAVTFIFSQKEPRKIEFIIDKEGIKAGDTFYNFKDLESFWIFYSPPEVKILSLKSGKTFSPYIPIQLGNQKPTEVRKVLLDFLSEEKQEESIIDGLARDLKF